MAFFPRSSYLGLYGGELHRRGGVLLKARLNEWERELNYLRFRIAEWKEFGSIEHPDYYPFRSFLLQKVRNHLHFELKTLSSILVACEVAVRSDDVPPLQNYVDSIFTFRERISPGEITRRIHVEEWHRYCRTKEGTTDTPSQMDDMFVRMRNEISAMERRSQDFKKMVDELVGLVDEMQERERIGGFANGLARGPRIPQARAGLVHSSSDLQGTRILADSRARLPPLPPGAAGGSPPRQPSSRPTRSSPLRHTATDSRPVARSPRNGASSAIAPRFSPPPRPVRNPQRRLFNRVLYISHSSSAPLSRPSPPSRVPSPPSAPVTPPTSGSRESPQSRLISETRTRLPPPLEVSPVPYRPPGQSCQG
ncbi:hypothetical protein BJY52DRAFT_1313337 [Lactarius psammicola]|nr:hypothetical protein BJY52DRAFT_1313337 [Lactarius psammicola]